jgi:PTS system nitrogen regulatory IIA component
MILGISDAAKILAITEDEVYRLIRDGSIPCTRVNEQYRFNRAELADWATRHVRAVAAVNVAATRARAPSLAAAIERGGIHRDVPTRSRAEALDAIAQSLPVPKPIDRVAVAEMLGARERLRPAGPSDGISLPTVWTPMIFAVDEPLVSFFFLAAPMDFDASDRSPIHTVVTLVAPTTRVHVRMLAVLSAALHDARFGDAVARRSPKDILAEAKRLDAPPTREG